MMMENIISSSIKNNNSVSNNNISPAFLETLLKINHNVQKKHKRMIDDVNSIVPTGAAAKTDETTSVIIDDLDIANNIVLPKQTSWIEKEQQQQQQQKQQLNQTCFGVGAKLTKNMMSTNINGRAGGLYNNNNSSNSNDHHYENNAEDDKHQGYGDDDDGDDYYGVGGDIYSESFDDGRYGRLKKAGRKRTQIRKSNIRGDKKRSNCYNNSSNVRSGHYYNSLSRLSWYG